MTTRGHVAPRLDPGRFRCLVCKRVVTGTASGHCPSCGFVPPSAPDASDPAAPIGLVAFLALLAIAGGIVIATLLL